MSKNTKPRTKRSKSSVKKTPKWFLLSLLRLVPKNRKAIVKAVLVVVIIVGVIGLAPLPYTFTKNVSVPFTTEIQESADLELGDSKIAQAGSDGKNIVIVEALRSFWGGVFDWQPIQQYEVSSEVTKKPINKVVVNGTRKYQYMLCSDGSSRYYTDEQFKDPSTGFTSKSEDYCKKNGQGEKLQLSDTSTGGATAGTERAPTITVRDGCTYTSIPYKTVYRDVSWLNKGETRVSKGSDGTKSSCGWSTEPINEEILTGTGESSSSYTSPENINNPDANAYNQCWVNYQNAMSQIQASASQGMGGTEALKRQVEAEFSRCTRAAGL